MVAQAQQKTVRTVADTTDVADMMRSFAEHSYRLIN
jgi:hypothetical protein